MPPKRALRISSAVIPRDIGLWLYERRLPLTLGALAVLGTALGWWAYQSWRTSQEEAAQLLMSRALMGLEASLTGAQGGKAPETRAGGLEEAQALLFQIRTEYPSSNAAEQALLLMGNIAYQKADHEKALKAYQEYLEKYSTGSWVVLAGVGKGYALEAQARYEDAAAIFRTLAERYKDSALGIEALLGLARSLTELERSAEAVEVYRRIAEEYAGTPWGRRAEELAGAAER
jgi:tetratricopeptide (TPR) repeat protein